MLFFFKQKTAYEMRISDLSSDVCSSDLLASRHPIVCHGLSLSLGGTGPLDETFLGKLRRFLDAHRVPIYSEHLSACSDAQDRTSVVYGKSVSVRVDLGGRRMFTQKKS